MLRLLEAVWKRRLLYVLRPRLLNGCVGISLDFFLLVLKDQFRDASMAYHKIKAVCSHQHRSTLVLDGEPDSRAEPSRPARHPARVSRLAIHHWSTLHPTLCSHVNTRCASFELWRRDL
ncbi:hypothetical protein L596_019182 [Steinernema carpocapsae]|uniref:Uncharacterized protein n=1 Tax=Steinernema carpocapsae TaxID=34508 RepID=A0A4U5N886_STECR|nr:hypothetical protein L596_019182 [Steinernema carpocapsae]